jgi:hypothetical protein
MSSKYHFSRIYIHQTIYATAYNSIAIAAITPPNIVAPLAYPAAAAPVKTLGWALWVTVALTLLALEVGITTEALLVAQTVT